MANIEIFYQNYFKQNHFIFYLCQPKGSFNFCELLQDYEKKHHSDY